MKKIVLLLVVGFLFSTTFSVFGQNKSSGSFPNQRKNYPKAIVNESDNYVVTKCGLLLENFSLYIYILPIYGKTLKLRPYAKKHDDMMLTANLNSSYSLELPQNMELQ